MRNKLVSIKRIIENEVGERIDTRNRKRYITYARAVYCKAGRDLGFSFSSIASEINRDHASVMHTVKNIFPFSQEEPYYKDLYNVISVVVDKHLRDAKDEAEQKIVEEDFDYTKQISKKVDELQRENDSLKYKLALLNRDQTNFNNLFEGLREEEIEEVYNKMNIFVKAIKSRVYL